MDPQSPPPPYHPPPSVAPGGVVDPRVTWLSLGLFVAAVLVLVGIFSPSWATSSGLPRIGAGLTGLELCAESYCQSRSWDDLNGLGGTGDLAMLGYLGILGGLASVGVGVALATFALMHKPNKIPAAVANIVFGASAAIFVLFLITLEDHGALQAAAHLGTSYSGIIAILGVGGLAVLARELAKACGGAALASFPAYPGAPWPPAASARPASGALATAAGVAGMCVAAGYALLLIRVISLLSDVAEVAKGLGGKGDVGDSIGAIVVVGGGVCALTFFVGNQGRKGNVWALAVLALITGGFGALTHDIWDAQHGNAAELEGLLAAILPKVRDLTQLIELLNAVSILIAVVAALAVVALLVQPVQSTVSTVAPATGGWTPQPPGPWTGAPGIVVASPAFTPAPAPPADPKVVADRVTALVAAGRRLDAIALTDDYERAHGGAIAALLTELRSSPAARELGHDLVERGRRAASRLTAPAREVVIAATTALGFDRLDDGAPAATWSSLITTIVELDASDSAQSRLGAWHARLGARGEVDEVERAGAMLVAAMAPTHARAVREQVWAALLAAARAAPVPGALALIDRGSRVGAPGPAQTAELAAWYTRLAAAGPRDDVARLGEALCKAAASDAATVAAIAGATRAQLVALLGTVTGEAHLLLALARIVALPGGPDASAAVLVTWFAGWRGLPGAAADESEAIAGEWLLQRLPPAAAALRPGVADHLRALLARADGRGRRLALLVRLAAVVPDDAEVHNDLAGAQRDARRRQVLVGGAALGALAATGVLTTVLSSSGPTSPHASPRASSVAAEAPPPAIAASNGNPPAAPPLPAPPPATASALTTPPGCPDGALRDPATGSCPPVSRAVVVAGAAGGATPRAVQLSYAMRELRFLGWTDDGTQFVIDGLHREPTCAGAADETCEEIRLAQVHDALTGLMTDSYQLAHVDGLSSSKLTQAWGEAQPTASWPRFTDRAALIGATPSLRSGPWTVTATAAGTIPGASQFSVEVDDRQVRYAWTDLIVDPPSRRAKAQRGPKVVVTLNGPDSSWPLIELDPIAYAYADVTTADFGDAPRMEGWLRLYWAPDGRRVVVVTGSRLVNVAPEADALKERYFVRALGPQVRVVDAGAGGVRARQVAEQLDQQGLAVTSVGVEEATVAATEVYFRGAAGPELATRAQALLPGPFRTVELKKFGWYDLIVVLGDPSLPPAGAGGGTGPADP